MPNIREGAATGEENPQLKNMGDESSDQKVQQTQQPQPFSTSRPSMSLSLAPRESLLRQCLLDCARTVPPLEIRFAGGWVRDKLLGRNSDDIDVALSTMSGKEFGEIFLKFYYGDEGEGGMGEEKREWYKMEARKVLGIDEGNSREEVKSGQPRDEKEPVTKKEDNKSKDQTEPGRKLAIVEEDAEKSKHLAVAKMKLLGLEIDLVNLRTEVYSQNSRTPQEIALGTAEEDAMRRDATINALFYNLHTGLVEDFTGKGLQDLLVDRVMRTPMEPFKTFRDDPLRVLRLIRFASKFDFAIDEEAQVAMRHPIIRQALRSKISRERVRIEIVKAFEGPRPDRALLQIYELGLFSCCFADPAETHEEGEAEAEEAEAARNGGQNFISCDGLAHIPKICDQLKKLLNNEYLVSRLQLDSPDTRSWPWLLACYVSGSASGIRGATSSATHAFKEAMKATVREVKLLRAAITNRAEISALAASVASLNGKTVVEGEPGGKGTSQKEGGGGGGHDSTATMSRGSLGMTIRRWGPSWGHQVLYSLLHDLTRPAQDSGEDTSDPSPLHDIDASSSPIYPLFNSNIVSTYILFLEHLDHINLERDQAINGIKPPLNGRQIIDVLDKKQPGPGNKLAADMVLWWRFDHPDEQDEQKVTEACASWLQSKRGLILAYEKQYGKQLMDPQLLEEVVNAG